MKVAQSNRTSNLPSSQVPIITEPSSTSNEVTHVESVPIQDSGLSSQSQTLQELNLTVNLPHAIKGTHNILNPKSLVNPLPVSRQELLPIIVSSHAFTVEPKKMAKALGDPFWVEAMQDELIQFDRNHV
ncbi:LOW QUALITY PROTEIN: hypothetical protein OSB04_023921 [Centaurea solstitialis]|uniref:Gag-Pol polyprotein n=1 Tax=Centaurea solstitialis TaxID=347529 RepID=A0AA38SK48_9ASTR|nr:LOW QUALITY PROTEIN: hypothetical protein OSB04_023921 [Centaurea solstitialis]